MRQWLLISFISVGITALSPGLVAVVLAAHGYDSAEIEQFAQFRDESEVFARIQKTLASMPIPRVSAATDTSRFPDVWLLIRWLSLNSTLTKAGSEKLLFLILEIDRTHGAEYLELNRLGRFKFLMSFVLWDEHPELRELIWQKVEPELLRELEEQLANLRAADVVVHGHPLYQVLKMYAKMLENAWDTRQLTSLESVLERISAFYPHRRDLRIIFYQGISESEAVRSAGSLDRFVEILMTESPALGRFCDYESWRDTLVEMEKRLDRGYAGAARNLSNAAKIFLRLAPEQQRQPEDVAWVTELLSRRVDQALSGALLSSVRELPHAMSDASLIQEIERTYARTEGKAAADLSALITRMHLIGQIGNELEGEARQEARAEANALLAVLRECSPLLEPES